MESNYLYGILICLYLAMTQKIKPTEENNTKET